MTTTPTPYEGPVGVRWAVRLYKGRKKALGPIDTLGFILSFVWEVLRSIPFTLGRYRGQITQQITSMTWGNGSIIVGGGTVPLMAGLGLAMGAGIAIQAFPILDSLGIAPMSGVMSSFALTREMAPIVAGIGFAAQAGCRMTAEIGSQRISEEIDALEALGLRSIPFVVTTRVIAGAVAVVPTFLITLILSYAACSGFLTLIYGVSPGGFDHYFFQFISGWDMVAAVIKVFVFAVAVILIHCYQGFFAAGGPEGVGIASGRAVRASFVAIIALDMVLTILLWGFHASIEFTG